MFFFDGRFYSLRGAIYERWICCETSKIFDPTAESDLMLKTAISRGIVDADLSLYQDAHGCLFNLAEARDLGYVLPCPQVTFADAVRNGNNVLESSIEGGFVSVRNFFLRYDMNVVTSLQRAIETDVVDLKERVVRLPSTSVNLVEAIDTGLIFHLPTKRVPLHLLFEYGLMVEKEGETLVFDRSSDGFVHFSHAFPCIDWSGVEFMCSDRPGYAGVSSAKAISEGLLDPKTGNVCKIRFNRGRRIKYRSLVSAWKVGWIKLRMKKPVSLFTAVNRHMRLSDNAVFDPVSGQGYSLYRACVSSFPLVNDNEKCFEIDRRLFTLMEAFARGVVSRDTGSLRLHGSVVPWDVASDRGIVRDPRAKVSLYEAAAYWLDHQSNHFVHPVTGCVLSLQQALDVRWVDSSSLVKNDSGEFMQLELAIRLGIVDPATNTVLSHGVRVTLPQALNDRIFVPSPKLKGYTLSELIEHRLINDNLIRNPVENQRFFLYEAFDSGLVNCHHCFYFDTPSNVYLSVQQAVHEGFITPNAVFTSDSEFSARAAIASGVLVDRIPTNFLTAIESGLIDPRTLTYRDSTSNLRIPLRSALSSGLVELGPGNEIISSKFNDNARPSFDPFSTDIHGLMIRSNMNSLYIFLQQPYYSLWGLIERGCMNFSRGTVRHPTTHVQLKLTKAIRDEFVRPNSAYVKVHDTLSLLDLRAALDAGYITDTTVMNTKTNTAISWITAIANRIVLFPDHPMDFMDALEYGRFGDLDQFYPLPPADAPLDGYTIEGAIRMGYLYIGDTKVRHEATGCWYPAEAMHVLTKDWWMDYAIVRGRTQEHVEHRYTICEERIDNLLLGLVSLEQLFVQGQGRPSDNAQDLTDKKDQVEEFSEQLHKQQGPVDECVSQAETLSLEGADILSPDEYHNLTRHREELYERYQRARLRTDVMWDRLRAAVDLRNRFDAEADSFERWTTTTDERIDQLVVGGDTRQMQHEAQTISKDIHNHQPDLQSINTLSMQVQEEIKAYLSELNRMRGSLTKPLPPVDYRDSEVRERSAQLTSGYSALERRCDDLFRLHSDLDSSARRYHDALRSADVWLTDMETRVKARTSVPMNSNPNELQKQISDTHDLISEVTNGERKVRDVTVFGEEFLAVLKGKDSYAQQQVLVKNESTSIADRHAQLSNSLTDHANVLQGSLAHTRGLRENLDGLVAWLRETEPKVDAHMPVPLEKEALARKITDQKMLRSDVESRHQAVVAVNEAMVDVQKSDPQLHKKLIEIDDRYNRIANRCQIWGERLAQAEEGLDEWHEQATALDYWLSNTSACLASPELTRLDLEQFAAEVSKYAEEQSTREQDLYNLRRLTEKLIAIPDACEQQSLRAEMKKIETKWAEVFELLKERKRQLSDRQRVMDRYTRQYARVVDWLGDVERRQDEFQPVALDLDVAKEQLDQLKPIITEHAQNKPELAEVNRVGKSYLAMLGVDMDQQQKQAITPESQVSSGFSSLDNMSQQQDLPKVQSELLDINNRYDLLGRGLRDREEEIDSLSKRLAKNQGDYDRLHDWVGTRKDRIKQAKGTLPFAKDEATRLSDDLKQIGTELIERRSDLEDFRSTTHDLTRLKPGVPGQEELTARASKLTVDWDEMLRETGTGTTRLNAFKEFHQDFNHLRSWLSAKQKMITVLGPIATEPSAINNQKQQVEVLKEEFSEQRPNLNAVNDTGSTLLESVGELGGHEAEAIAGKLSNLNQKWDELMQKLEERDASLQAADGLSKDFHQRQAGLLEYLAGMAAQIDQLSTKPAKTQAEIDEQLESIQALQRDLDTRSKDIDTVGSTCDELSDVSGDPALKADLMARMNALKQPFSEAKRKLESLQSSANSQLAEGRQLDLQLQHLLNWLDEVTSLLGNQPAISADPERLRRQIHEFEPIYKDILDHEGSLQYSLAKARELTEQGKGPSPELIDKVEQKWTPALAAAKDRQQRLTRASDVAKQFDLAMATILDFITDAELKLAELKSTPLTLERSSFERHLKTMHKFRSEVTAHRQEYKSAEAMAEQVMNATEANHEVVQDRIDDLAKRWEALNVNAKAYAKEVDGQVQSLADHESLHADAKAALQGLELAVANANAQESRGLDRLKQLLDECQGPIKSRVSAVTAQADEIKHGAPDSSDAKPLDWSTENLVKRHGTFEKDLVDKIDQLQTAGDFVGKFKDECRGLTTDLKGLLAGFADLGPVSRDPDAIKSQKTQSEDFEGQLASAQCKIDDARKRVEQLRKDGFDADADACEKMLDDLQQQLDDLKKKAGQRTQELDTLDSRVGIWLSDVDQARSSIMDTLGHDALKETPVNELDAVHGESEKVKVFKDSLDPLHTRVSGLLEAGRELARDAAPGADTSRLDGQSAALNEAWSELKERVAAREDGLQRALLGLGSFNEGIMGIKSWLDETEALVDSQKAPSADHKVIRAQLQEQRLLQRLIDDKQPNIEQLQAAADHVGKDRREIDEVVQRYNKLADLSNDRRVQLEEALELAEQWSEHLEPFLSWLDSSERRLHQLDTVPTDPEKLRGTVDDHKIFHEEIEGQRDQLDGIVDTGRSLEDIVGEDDCAAVERSLRETAARYDKLGSTSQALGSLLLEMVDGVSAFLHNTEDIAAWLDRVEGQLAASKNLSVFTEVLHQQTDDLMKLGEEIAHNQERVMEAVEEGHELCKHTSNEEAIQLQSKLDSLRSRYTDLSRQADTGLQAMQEALPLAQTYHETHAICADVLQGIEADLAHLDEETLMQQQEFLESMEVDCGELRGQLDSLQATGTRLGQLAGPGGDGAATLDSMTGKLNKRFDAVVEQVQRRTERLSASRQRSVELMQDIDELVDWFQTAESTMLQAGAASSDPQQTAAAVRDQRLLNNDVISQKTRARDVVSTGKRISKSLSGDDAQTVADRTDALRDIAEGVSTLSADRLAILEQALPLSEDWNETYTELADWLSTAESELANAPPVTPGMHAEQIARQVEHNQGLQMGVNQNKPILDKLTKSAAALSALCNSADAEQVTELTHQLNMRFDAVRDNVRRRGGALDDCQQANAHFADKLAGMLNALESTADQVHHAEPVAAHPSRIRDQIRDNCAMMNELEHKAQALEAVKRAAAEVIDKADPNDPAVGDVLQKLSRLDYLWDDVQRATELRGRRLSDTLAIAERFWDELDECVRLLDDLGRRLDAVETTGCQPEGIQSQQDELNILDSELQLATPHVDACREAGAQLLDLVGESEKGEVTARMSELDSAWTNVTALYAQRNGDLIAAMDQAMSFYELLREVTNWLNQAESTVTGWRPVGSRLEEIQQQIDDLHRFKGELNRQTVQLERLNQEANALIDGSSPDQVVAVKRPLQSINRRWEAISLAVNDRQAALERALLQMGQFNQALDQLASWITGTALTLDELKPVPGDLQGCEILLARLKVIQNDIDSHASSVHTLNDAGRRLISSGVEAPEQMQASLDDLNLKWAELQEQMAKKGEELARARKEAEGFSGHIHTWLDWLSNIESALSTSKPVGGLPETAQEQLDNFMATFQEMETSRPLIEEVIAKGLAFTEQSEANRASALAHSVLQLRQRWNNASNRAADRKIKLEVALKDAVDFDALHKECAAWIAAAEKELHALQPVSRLKEPLQKQIDANKDLQSRVEVQRGRMLELEKKGTHLKYFSQKQDVIVVKNKLVTTSSRWDRLLARIAERGRQLDNAAGESNLFYEGFDGLMTWIGESSDWLSDQQGLPSSNPEKVKENLAALKQFNKDLAARQGAFEATMKVGKELKNHAPKNEQDAIQHMISRLKDSWSDLVTRSTDRHRRLEEALLFSGEFNEAVAELQAFLDRAKEAITAEENVGGDLESVQLLQEKHRALLAELKSCGNNMETVRRAAAELTANGDEESTRLINEQMGRLNQSWDDVNGLATNKSSQLEEAMREAESFHAQGRALLDALAGIESRLKAAGPAPDDPEGLHHHEELIDQLKYELAEQKQHKIEAVELGSSILAKAHPEARQPMQHWISLLASRYDEVSAWCTEREGKVQENMRTMHRRDQLIDELLHWLADREERLDRADREPIMEDAEMLDALIREHQQFQDGLKARQPEIDDATTKSKRDMETVPVAQPVSRTGRKTPVTPSQKKVRKTDPKVKAVSDKWRHLWLVCAERQRKLQDMKNLLEEMEKVKNFSFEEWRRRYMAWMNHKKARVMDFFRRQDKDQDGKVTRAEFIEGILQSKFPTNRLEMNAVADIFDKDKDGYIDYKEFIAALRPDREPTEPRTDSQRIKDEMHRQVELCTCSSRFRVKEVGEGRYTFGETQKLRLVRILRSTVMVRVGGGWTALDEFLVKNDPCRAKGRTNLELREKFILPEGASQTMQAFRARPAPAARPGSSSGASSTFSTPQGPVIKIREKTERSLPMRASLGRAGSAQSPADSEVSSIFSDRRSSDANGAARPASRSSGRGRLLGAYGSRPGSSRGSRPPSRAGSDISEAGSLASRDSLAAVTPSRIPSARKKWRN